MAICGVKFRAYPTKEQSQKLAQWIGCARVIYNCKVEEDYLNYQQFKNTNQKTAFNQAFSHFKTQEREWLKKCPSQILRNSAVNWFTSKQRFFKKLAKNPRKKHKGKRDSVLLTRELFTFQEEKCTEGKISHKLLIGTKKNPIGELKFIAHREYEIPKQMVISVKGGQWFVSFCYEVDMGLEKTQEQLLDEYSSLEEQELNHLTIGIDRGIVIPFQISNKTLYDFDIKTKIRLKKKQRKLKRYQRKLARQKLDSNTRKRTKIVIGKLHAKIGNIRHDFCHKTSHSLAESEAKVFAVEDLQLKNMTKAPMPKKDQNGKFIPNGARAKAGLNRELLSKGLSKTIIFLEYKARRRGKIVIKVPAHHSSQECAICSHIHPDNRKSQSEFLCIACGNHDNADINAAKVIAKRGVLYLLSKPTAKTTTRLGNSRSNARRGICKTEIELLFSQIPETLEANPL